MVKRNLQKCHKIKYLLYCILGICIEQKTSLANSQFSYKMKACLLKFENGKKKKTHLNQRKNIFNILERPWIGIMYSGSEITPSVDEERLKNNSGSSFLFRYRLLSRLSRNLVCFFHICLIYLYNSWIIWNKETEL